MQGAKEKIKAVKIYSLTGGNKNLYYLFVYCIKPITLLLISYAFAVNRIINQNALFR